MGLADNLDVTAWEPTTEPSEAAPARTLRSADISALLPQVGLLTVHVRQHQREVCRLSPWDNVALRLNPYPADYRPAFACSLLLYPPPHQRLLREPPSLTGRRRAYHVPPLLPCGLGRASPPVVQQLRTVSSEHRNLTTYCRFTLVTFACRNLKPLR